MTFPVCKHRKKPFSSLTGPGALTWLAAEPFRVFFVSGALWSMIGVSLWPLFYSGHLEFYPGITHARLMIEAFGGAFVVGFLGTAGPRMANAPKLTPVELLALFALHMANGVCHLKLMIREADLCFILMLGLLLLSLVLRVAFCRKEAPPPQMLLVLAGLLCGIVGSAMMRQPVLAASPSQFRLAGLFLYQGLLLLPVLGIGSFIFPRVLGGSFDVPATAGDYRDKLLRAVAAAALIIASFFIETSGAVILAYLLRAGCAIGWLLSEIRWRRDPGAAPHGTLANGLYWSLGTGLIGLAVTGFFYDRHVPLEHLLYVGCFGLLILIVASRVLFGHSGELAGFARRSWPPRIIIALALIAAATRASAEFWPAITISHHKYAAWLWGLACLAWLVWHRGRFLKREDE